MFEIPDITQRPWGTAARPYSDPGAPSCFAEPAQKCSKYHRIVIEDAMDDDAYEAIIETLNRQVVAYEEEA